MMSSRQNSSTSSSNKPTRQPLAEINLATMPECTSMYDILVKFYRIDENKISSNHRNLLKLSVFRPDAIQQELTGKKGIEPNKKPPPLQLFTQTNYNDITTIITILS